MKKAIAFILVMVLAVSVCACGSSSNSTTSNSVPEQENVSEDGSELVPESNTENATEEVDTSSDAEKEDEMQEEMEELSTYGEVEVEDGILTVSITLPADYAEGVTQEELDAQKGTAYKSATINEDGSVTYKMTKKQHSEMMKEIVSGFEEAAQEMVDDDENYSMTAVTHNNDLTQFDVTLSGTQLGLGDSFAAVSFYMYGYLYGIFNGKQPEHIVVNYYDPDGNLIESGDSADMEDQEE